MKIRSTIFLGGKSGKVANAEILEPSSEKKVAEKVAEKLKSGRR
jgi:hypothetical protein